MRRLFIRFRKRVAEGYAKNIQTISEMRDLLDCMFESDVDKEETAELMVETLKRYIKLSIENSFVYDSNSDKKDDLQQNVYRYSKQPDKKDDSARKISPTVIQNPYNKDTQNIPVTDNKRYEDINKKNVSYNRNTQNIPVTDNKSYGDINKKNVPYNRNIQNIPVTDNKRYEDINKKSVSYNRNTQNIPVTDNRRYEDVNKNTAVSPMQKRKKASNRVIDYFVITDCCNDIKVVNTVTSAKEYFRCIKEDLVELENYVQKNIDVVGFSLISNKLKSFESRLFKCIEGLLNELSYDSDYISERVTVATFSVISDDFIKKIISGIYDRIHTDGDDYIKIMPYINRFLETAGIYTYVCSGAYLEEYEFEYFDIRTVNVSNGSLENKIKEIKRLPYCVNYIGGYGQTDMELISGQAVIYGKLEE